MSNLSAIMSSKKHEPTPTVPRGCDAPVAEGVGDASVAAPLRQSNARHPYPRRFLRHWMLGVVAVRKDC